MSESSAFGFGQFVPGFDFLQNLSKTAAQAAPATGAVPGMASWVAPTLSVEELDKRIQELKAVQFWLDQNATALKATIQAMEVQKMTLSTLQSMNVNMADLAKAFTVKAPESEAPSAAEPEEKSRASIFSPKTKPTPEPVVEPEVEPFDASVAEEKAESDAQSDTQLKAASDKPAVDPMQWWGALTQQFQGIAAAAMKDVASEAMKAGVAAQNAAKSGAAARTAGAMAQSKTKTKTKSSPRASGAAAAQPGAKKVAKSAPAAHKSAAKTRAKSSAQTATKTAARSSRPVAPKRAAK
jgi:hypothetical protein